MVSRKLGVALSKVQFMGSDDIYVVGTPVDYLELVAAGAEANPPWYYAYALKEKQEGKMRTSYHWLKRTKRFMTIYKEWEAKYESRSIRS